MRSALLFCLLAVPCFADIVAIDAGSALENSCTGSRYGSAQQPDLANQSAPFNTLRYGPSFTCTIQAPVGTCRVTLQFLENRPAVATATVPSSGPGLRLFTASVNGLSTPPLDLFTLAGAQTPYTTPPITVPVVDGFLHLSFVAGKGNAVLSGIQANCATPTPPSITGVPCDSLRPAKGIAMVVNLPDGTCLPISVIAATGFLADSISIYTQASLDGTVAAQLIWALLTPR